MIDHLTDTNVGNIEYIRRQDAVMQLSHNKSRGDDEWELAVASDMEIIRTLPSADVAPVVRCKDCKGCEYDTAIDQYWCTRGRMIIGRHVMPDDFCGYGERE